MTRSRLIGGLLGLVLLACAAVIVLDQNGMLSSGTQTTKTQKNNTPTPSDPGNNTSNGDGYGGLK